MRENSFNPNAGKYEPENSEYGQFSYCAHINFSLIETKNCVILSLKKEDSNAMRIDNFENIKS